MSGYKETIDTSHYAECATLLLKYRKRHQNRLIATIVLLIINFYLQTIFFAQKYAGPSIRAVMYNNADLAVNPGDGVLMLLFTGVIVFVIWQMIKKGTTPKKLGAFIGISVLLMGGYTIYQLAGNAHVHREGPAPHQLPFAYGILAIFFSLVCIVLAFLGEQKRPKFHAALIIMTLIGGLTTCFSWGIVVVLLFMYVLAIPEFRKMQWIMQQDGYPYFNERFEESKLHAEYEPMHKLDHRSFGEMADLDGNVPDAASCKAQEEAHRAAERLVSTPQMDYTLRTSEDPAEMPGIDDIFEHVEPIADPEPPKAEDIPDPKWDVPDISTDIPDTNWNVPDVNMDIPDLPEIPDIPKL